MPSAAASSAARTARSMLSRSTPGSEATGSATSVPSRTKIGQIRSAGVSRASATRSRIQGVRRSRRGRASGKGARLMAPGFGTAPRRPSSAKPIREPFTIPRRPG